MAEEVRAQRDQDRPRGAPGPTPSRRAPRRTHAAPPRRSPARTAPRTGRPRARTDALSPFARSPPPGRQPALAGPNEQRTRVERRQQAGAEERRLAAARRPDDREQRRVLRAGRRARRRAARGRRRTPASPVSNGASPLNGQTLQAAVVVRRRPSRAQRPAPGPDEDRPLELLQLDPRLEPELVGQERPRPPIDVETLRLTARPVEGEHELRAEALAVRVLGDQGLELGDERELTAERELGVDPLLDRRQPQLLEPLRPRHARTARTRDRRAAARPTTPPRRGTTPPQRRRRRPRAPRGRPPRAARTARGRARRARRAGGSRERARRAAARRPRPAPSTLRSRETWLRSAWSAEFTLCSANSSPISRSRETTRFALSSSSASSARCFGPPIGTATPSTRTASGPRIPNSRRVAAIAPHRVSLSRPASTTRQERFGTALGHARRTIGGDERRLHATTRYRPARPRAASQRSW